MARPRYSSVKKFWDKTDKRSDNECWLFLGSKDKDGYGQFWDGDNQVMTRAHRFSAELHHGKQDLCVCHTCDNPLCVNPSHLFYGTHQANIADKVSKNRQAKGEQQGHSKLSNDIVIALMIRAEEGYKTLCKEFSIAPSTLYRIWNNQSWKHLAR